VRVTKRGERALGWALTLGLVAYMCLGNALATWLTGVSQ
jgi:hypothetical protein